VLGFAGLTTLAMPSSDGVFDPPIVHGHMSNDLLAVNSVGN
jgi:hypothetical protein